MQAQARKTADEIYQKMKLEQTEDYDIDIDLDHIVIDQAHHTFDGEWAD